MLAFNLAHLAGGSYGRYAENHIDKPRSARTIAAARHGAELTPWVASRVALQGWVLTERDEHDAASHRYTQALRWSPADALLWAEYALALGRADRYPAMALPTQRANALAPYSPAVQGAVAAMGAAYWQHGSPEQHAQWLSSLRHTVAHQGWPFMQTLAARGHLRSLCAGPVRELKLGRLCTTVRRRAEQCDTNECPP